MDEIKISFEIPGDGKVEFAATHIDEESDVWIERWRLKVKFEDEPEALDLKPIGIYRDNKQKYHVYWADDDKGPGGEWQMWSISDKAMVPSRKKENKKYYEQFKEFVRRVLESLKINDKKPDNLKLLPEKDKRGEPVPFHPPLETLPSPFLVFEPEPTFTCAP